MSAPADPGALRAAILSEARAWIGTPYLHRASLKGHGADCLGLVRGVWRACLGDEPEEMSPYAPHWPLATREEPLRVAARRYLIPAPSAWPGDVLLFRWRAGLPASHAGILASEASFIHAHDGAAVAEVAFTAWWRRHLVDVFSFPGAAG